MQAVLSNPPESSTDACAAFHDTACTFPLWCTSVWSHCPVVTSHTCECTHVSSRLGVLCTTRRTEHIRALRVQAV